MPFIEGTAVDFANLVEADAFPQFGNALRASPNNPRYFGITPAWRDAPHGTFGYFVGIGRLPEAPDNPLIVNPRNFNHDNQQFQIDYLAMYAACAAHPDVSPHLDACLTIYDDETPIEAPDQGHWSPLIALAFIKATQELVQRHLRRGFITRQEDLRGRIRGQIMVGRYVATSLAKAHPEIVPCRFQALEQNTLENRILRTALVGAKRLLDGATGQNLTGRDAQWRLWSRQIEAALAGATIARITPRDFLAARKSGTYSHYARPLSLARAILTRTGFDPSQPTPDENQNQAVRLVPFRLATAELFERYVEVCLRNIQGLKVWAGYTNENLGERFKVRPDFLVSENAHRVVVDAKYKDINKQAPGNADDENSLRADIYQILAHALHTGVIQRLEPSIGVMPTGVILCYPTFQENADNFDAILQQPNWQELQVGADQRKITDFNIPILLLGIGVPHR